MFNGVDDLIDDDDDGDFEDEFEEEDEPQLQVSSSSNLLFILNCERGNYKSEWCEL